MTQAITTPEPETTHFAITYTGVHYPLTQERADLIMQAPQDSEFVLEGALVKRKNIADVLPREKYYESYPDRRPTTYDKQVRDFYDFSGYNGVINSAAKTRNGLAALKGGVMKAIKNMEAQTGKPANKARALLAAIELKEKQRAAVVDNNA